MRSADAVGSGYDARKEARAAADRAVPRWLVPAALALGAAVVVLLASLPGLPYQDVPNHLSRAVAIADLLYDRGARFGGTFSFEWQFVPYILGDALHVATLAWLPPDVAARLWMVAGFVCIPLATGVLLRTWGCSRFAIATVLAFTVYLASDWFLLLGFLNFRYGLALALLGIAAWERVIAAPRATNWAAYALVVVAAYLMHLAAVVMLVAAIGTLSLVRLARGRGWTELGRVRVYALAGAPPLLMFAWHVAFRGGKEVGAAVQPELLAKIVRVVAPFVPFRDPVEILIALAFLAVLAAPVLASRFRGWPSRAVECAALAVAFGAMYCVLPEVQGAVWGVDFRALPFAWLFATVAVVLVVESRARRAWVLPAAAVAVGAVHVATLWPMLAEQDAHNRAYRRIAAQVPAGATVLPVVTRPRQGLLSPSAHAASFATIDSVATVPYTFWAASAPMPYFRFVHPPPRHPDQWWYVNDDPPPRWAGLLDGYDYALVEVPARWSRIPLRGRVVTANDAVALLALPRAQPARTVHAGGRMQPAASRTRPRGGASG